MQVLKTNIFFFTVCFMEHAQTKINPHGENVCLYNESYQENIVVLVEKPVHVIKKSWCFNLRNFFRCEEEYTNWQYFKEPRTVTRSKIVPKCCIGYTEEEDYVTKCLPVCMKGCENGECVAPEICNCKPGFYGTSCNKVCPSGLWGKNCRNKCDCSSNGKCHIVSGKCDCEPGWRGDRCELPCQSGYFGYSCKFECDCSSQSCDPITGQCPTSVTVTTTTENSTETFLETDQTTLYRVSVAEQSETQKEILSENFADKEMKPIDAITHTSIFDSTESQDINISEKTNFWENTTNETVPSKMVMNTLDSLENLNSSPIIPGKEILSEKSNPEDFNHDDNKLWLKEKDFFESETVSEPNKITKTLKSFISTETNAYEDITDNFISEKHGDSDEKTVPIFYHFLPTFAVLFGVSFITFITVAGWVLVKHRKKVKIIGSEASYKDTVFHMEEKGKYQCEDYFWVSFCNHSKNTTHVSESDVKNTTPVLKTFKPMEENKMFISKER